MPKSKFPAEIDSSVELPLVRDNITEIRSDIINSLRSAIFQIEKTLGINPQGAAGNTVSSRLNQVLDDNGNILKVALDRANVLSGPILNTDVADSAGIDESKLNLNFSTQYLYNELSSIESILDEISNQIDSVNAKVSAHIHRDAINRHNATAITIAAADDSPSDSATVTLNGGDLQTIVEDLYNSHILYTGADVTSSNNSHSANQIYYNNENVTDVITHNDVQNAIDDIALVHSRAIRNNVLELHSNGVLRNGYTYDKYGSVNNGLEIISNAQVTYSAITGASINVITFTTPEAVSTDINQFDTLVISGSASDVDNKSYQISSVEYNIDGDVESISIFGGPLNDSGGTVVATVYKTIYNDYNNNGLNCVAKPRFSRTNTPDIQVANPNCAIAISSGLDAGLISSSAHTFDIEIDGNSAVTISTYDATISSQTIDSIVNKINEQACDQHLNFSAYKLRVGSCYELAISHTVPDFDADVVRRSIVISLGSTNDGTSQLGLTAVLNYVNYGSYGNSFNVNGYVIKESGLLKTYTSDVVRLVSNSRRIEFIDNSVSFITDGVRVGDYVVITNSSDTSEDGTYRISSISSNYIEVDNEDVSFLGEISDSSIICILRCTAPIDEMAFQEFDGDVGSILFDVFITSDADIFYRKRLEIEGELSDSSPGGNFVASIVDVSRSFIISGETSSITIGIDGYAQLTGPDSQVGQSVYVGTTGRYAIKSADGLHFVVLSVKASSLPDEEISASIYGYDEIGQSNLHVCRGTYSTALGRVLGEGTDVGIPSVLDKRVFGTIGTKSISSNFIEKYIEGPRNELRASGVLSGCLVSSASYDSGSETYTFDVDPGTVISNGIRHQNNGASSVTFSSTDSIYIAIDEYGCIIAQPAQSNGQSPFISRNIALLALLKNDGSTLSDNIDIRLFISGIDNKVTSEIIVSNNSDLGHFTSISDAVAYAKYFGSIYSNSTTPSIFIRDGQYAISEQIVLDFDIKIRGSGPNTILTRSGALSQGESVGVGESLKLNTALFIIGATDALPSEDIVYGVSVSDLTYKVSDDFINSSCIFAITQSINDNVGDFISSSKAYFRFSNITFDGPGIMGDGSIQDYPIVLTHSDSLAVTPYQLPSSKTFGNVLVSNCIFYNMGTTTAINSAFVDATCTVQNSIFSSNISVGDVDAVMLEISDASATSSNIIESSNIIIDI